VRLDHLLSKEHLQPVAGTHVPDGWLSGVQPVAQTQVLRRVLMGGISTNRCLAALAGYKYGPCGFSSERAWWSWNGTGLDRRVVFGTLLGPEATGPGLSPGLVFLVSWLHRSYGLVPLRGLVWGVWFGVVV
jgi:hypothetical protein